MLLFINTMEFYKEEDLRLSQQPFQYPIKETAKNVFYKSYNASSYDSNGIYFSCKIPKSGLLLDRMIFLKAKIKININYSQINNLTHLLNDGRCGLRSYPLLKAASSLKTVINGRGIELGLSDVLSALELYEINLDDKRLVLSKTPTYPANQAQQFKDTNSSNRSSFANYASSIDNTVTQSFPWFITPGTNKQIVAGINDDGAAQVNFETCEPIWLSPYYVGNPKFDNTAIPGIKNLEFSVSFVPNGERRMFAIDPYDQNIITLSGDLTSSFSFSEPPKILIQYLEPENPIDINKSVQFLNTEFQIHSKDYGQTINQDTEVVIDSEDIIIGTIPDRIFIFARRSNSEMQGSFFHPDSFFAIEKVNLTWENDLGIFSECSKQQLYDISLRNGLSTEWSSFSGKKLNKPTSGNNFGKINHQFSGTGSVFCFTPSDFGTQYIPGTRQNLNLNLKVTVKNIDKIPIQPTLYVVLLVNNVLKFQDGDSISRSITVDEVVNKPECCQVLEQKGCLGLIKSRLNL